MKALDMSSIYKKYKGLWVALENPNKPKVIAFGKTLKETLQKAKDKGFNTPLVTQIPKKILPIFSH